MSREKSYTTKHSAQPQLKNTLKVCKITVFIINMPLFCYGFIVFKLLKNNFYPKKNPVLSITDGKNFKQSSIQLCLFFLFYGIKLCSVMHALNSQNQSHVGIPFQI